jgi:hypothetical protein
MSARIAYASTSAAASGDAYVAAAGAASVGRPSSSRLKPDPARRFSARPPGSTVHQRYLVALHDDLTDNPDSKVALWPGSTACQPTATVVDAPTGYPTRAREEVDPRELVEVGTIGSRTGRLEITATATELSWWIGPADLADLGFRLEAR